MNEAQARRRPAWGQLASELRRLRELAGLNRAAIGAAIGKSAETVTRIELAGAHGGSPPSVKQVMDWATACAVAKPDLGVLAALADAARNEHRPYREWGTLASIQAAIAADEATARTVRNFNPWGIPGLFQLPAYARAVMEMTGRAADVAAAVAARMARQAILGKPGHVFEFILTEEGLRRRPGSVAQQRNQLAHLAEESTRPGVSVRVIPLGRTLPVTHGFVLYEDRDDDAGPFVSVELEHARLEASTPVDVEDYRARLVALRGMAVPEGDTVQLVGEVTASL